MKSDKTSPAGGSLKIRLCLQYADADTITQLVFGSLSSDSVRRGPFSEAGDPSCGIKLQRGTLFLVRSDDGNPPPTDVPEDCECGVANYRGETKCGSCGESLDTRSRYEVWLVALIRSYLGERYGVKLGAKYSDVLKWLPHMRPYPTVDDASAADFGWSIYAITHIVYTLNDYNSYQLNRRWLPDEYQALSSSLDAFISMDDPETVGEILDCRTSFKVNNSNPLIQRGARYLLDRQNPDGSWGEIDGDAQTFMFETTPQLRRSMDSITTSDAEQGLAFQRLRNSLSTVIEPKFQHRYSSTDPHRLPPFPIT